MRESTLTAPTREDAKYSSLIDESLSQIKVIHRDLAKRRAEGLKVDARIDKNLRQIQTAIDCVKQLFDYIKSLLFSRQGRSA